MYVTKRRIGIKILDVGVFRFVEFVDPRYLAANLKNIPARFYQVLQKS